MDPKIIARYAVRETMGLVVMGVALFWPAGRIDWWAAWAAIAVMAAWTIATAVVILRFNPVLLLERLGPRKGAKRWDIAILGAMGLTQLARYVVAGFDERYDWSSGISLAAQIAALVVCILGFALVVWATAANSFFSQVAHVQPGQVVITGGPYSYVRHPGYAGAIVAELAVPILLASWWALALGVLGAILLVIRTALEDRMLRAELGGYTEYALRVRHRLVPGIW